MTPIESDQNYIMHKMYNQKIIDYDTIEEIHLGRLERSVAEGIAKGWQPIGGVAVIEETEHLFRRFVQTMVYYEET